MISCGMVVLCGLPAGFSYFSELPQDVVLPPSVALLSKCGLSPRKDMLEVSIGGIAEGEVLFIAEPLTEVSGGRQGLVGCPVKEDEPGLQSAQLPDLLRAHCFELGLLLVCRCHGFLLSFWWPWTRQAEFFSLPATKMVFSLLTPFYREKLHNLVGVI